MTVESISKPKITFFESQIILRGKFLYHVPTSFIEEAFATMKASVAGLFAIVTLGKHRATYSYANERLTRSACFLSYPYLFFLKTVNPYAAFRPDDKTCFICYKAIGGLGTPYVIKRMRLIAYNYSQSQYWFVKNVSPRLIFVALAIACLVARTVDFILGMIAAAFSILTVGKIASLNHFAYRGLQSTCVINDLFISIMYVINPNQNNSSVPKKFTYLVPCFPETQ